MDMQIVLFYYHPDRRIVAAKTQIVSFNQFVNFNRCESV